jgi:hypothetical protein
MAYWCLRETDRSEAGNGEGYQCNKHTHRSPPLLLMIGVSERGGAWLHELRDSTPLHRLEPMFLVEVGWGDNRGG